jgi:hypothetical protein
MEHLTLPSVGASFKKWGCCTPILPKALAILQTSKKNLEFFLKKFKKWAV